MTTIIVVSVILVLLVGVVMLEARDVIFARFRPAQHPLAEAPPPFLVIQPRPNDISVRPMSVGEIPRRSPSRDFAPLSAPTDGATVVFRRPTDEPVRILPGRLEVVAGPGIGEDFPLVGGMGEETEVIIGREAGTPTGITLRSPTVSRRHARMTFADGAWGVTNLSRTNPLLINDRPLSADGEKVPLTNGDRIELGNVILAFHV
jgi:hypothetical protein